MIRKIPILAAAVGVIALAAAGRRAEARRKVTDAAKATPAHQDFLYIQGSTETVTAWMPLGDVPAALGGLMVQPGSHKAGFYLPFKHPGVGGNAVAYDADLPWAGTDYKAGDVLLFHSLT